MVFVLIGSLLLGVYTQSFLVFLAALLIGLGIIVEGVP
jgi:hypothetical protein